MGIRGEEMEMTVRPAQTADMEKMIIFLREAGLETAGAENMSENFLILEDKIGNIQGTLGIERLGKYGLLRSFAVSRQVLEKDLLILFREMLKLAKSKAIENVYLAVNKPTTANLFSMFGFVIQEKSSLPAELLQSSHAKQILTVDNSLFMMLNLK